MWPNFSSKPYVLERRRSKKLHDPCGSVGSARGILALPDGQPRHTRYTLAVKIYRGGSRRGPSIRAKLGKSVSKTTCRSLQHLRPDLYWARTPNLPKTSTLLHEVTPSESHWILQPGNNLRYLASDNWTAPSELASVSPLTFTTSSIWNISASDIHC
ncbi:hypothetical protein BDY21DRAFT_107308 [Lineolata rhizophorae]|uniref:Uncharacterized protein n=1 Tax=Lineolata rhizophorae TaxID=578093 RepID=A0A6A6NR62_9PEZI|nr:hypothetical protein BDY21DRAFT_107308 [Lineolata rhizophorae]